MNVPVRSFEELYPDKSKEIKRAFKEYIDTVRAGTGTGTGDENVPKIGIELDGNRFPIAPRISSDKKVTKADMEQLYRLYMTYHYRECRPCKKSRIINNILGLACKDWDRQAPFNRISSNPSDFIDPEYLPNGIKICDPRSMKLDALIKFFQHITGRETSHGITDAFRFKAVLSTRKKGVLRKPRYNISDAESDPAPVVVRKKRPKKTKETTQTSQAGAEVQEVIPDQLPAPGPTVTPAPLIVPVGAKPSKRLPKKSAPAMTPAVTPAPVLMPVAERQPSKRVSKRSAPAVTPVPAAMENPRRSSRHQVIDIDDAPAPTGPRRSSRNAPV